jgi:hypothetical protein
MELFNKSGLLVSSVLVLVGALIACQAKEDAVPSATVIEAAAMQITTTGPSAAERHLQEWADQGSAVAQRELALRYKADPARRSEALHLFEQAARAGDTQAELGLVTMYREANALGGTGTINELNASRMLKEVGGVRTASLYR